MTCTCGQHVSMPCRLGQQAPCRSGCAVGADLKDVGALNHNMRRLELGLPVQLDLHAFVAMHLVIQAGGQGSGWLICMGDS